MPQNGLSGYSRGLVCRRALPEGTSAAILGYLVRCVPQARRSAVGVADKVTGWRLYVAVTET